MEQAVTEVQGHVCDTKEVGTVNAVLLFSVLFWAPNIKVRGFQNMRQNMVNIITYNSLVTLWVIWIQGKVFNMSVFVGM